MLQWNILLIDCSTQWGEHFCNWHMRSISNSARDNSSTRSERVSIPRHLFVASATITRDSGKLEWNTLLIDCSSHWGDNLCNYSFHCRDPGMLKWNTLLIDCSSQWGEHLCNWIIWSISNGSRNNSSTRSLRISIPRHLCVASANIPLIEANNLCNWHIWSMANGLQQ